jgi:phage terminase large subunit
VQAEGVVYEGWDEAVHLIDPRPIPPHWRRYWAIDFGFTLRHPLVILWWAVDDQGIAHLYREYRRVGVLVEDAAREALRVSEGEPRPVAVVADHDAEDRVTFERHPGLHVTPADKGVTAGIQEVAERLVVQRDGRPRLLIHRGALCHAPDEALAAA